jgi:hypothetical protein
MTRKSARQSRMTIAEAQPNDTNNRSQYGHAAWNTTVPQPECTRLENENL